MRCAKLRFVTFCAALKAPHVRVALIVLMNRVSLNFIDEVVGHLDVAELRNSSVLAASWGAISREHQAGRLSARVNIFAEIDCENAIFATPASGGGIIRSLKTLTETQRRLIRFESIHLSGGSGVFRPWTRELLAFAGTRLARPEAQLVLRSYVVDAPLLQVLNGIKQPFTAIRIMAKRHGLKPFIRTQLAHGKLRSLETDSVIPGDHLHLVKSPNLRQLILRTTHDGPFFDFDLFEHFFEKFRRGEFGWRKESTFQCAFDSDALAAFEKTRQSREPRTETDKAIFSWKVPEQSDATLQASFQTSTRVLTVSYL